MNWSLLEKELVTLGSKIDQTKIVSLGQERQGTYRIHIQAVFERRNLRTHLSKPSIILVPCAPGL